MAAYYNEIDPNAAQWLRELIKMGAIAPGDVDERSIEDVFPDDLRTYSQCHFFAGVGGWSLALRLAGWPDDRPVWTGSAPCQPFSAAGKGGGIADERHLWPALFWLISQCRPETVFGEQVASKDGLGWWDIVSADLEGAGYACGANDLCAPGLAAVAKIPVDFVDEFTGKPFTVLLRDVPSSAPHLRQRLYWVANTDSPGRQWQGQTQSAGRGHNPIAIGGEQVSPLANAQCPERGAIAEGWGSEQHGAVGERQAPSGSTNGSTVSTLAHPESAECECTRGTRAGRAGSTDRRPWDNPIWLPCADGKARPAQSSIFKMVDGISCRMGYSGYQCVSLKEEEEIEDGPTTKARSREVLRNVRDSVDPEGLRGCEVGRSFDFQEAEVLQPEMHGRSDGGDDQGREPQELPPSICEDPQGELREMRQGGFFAACPSQRPQSHEQRPVELDDVVRFLSPSLSFAQLHGDGRTESALQNLWQTIGEAAALQYPLNQAEEAWRSLAEEGKARLRMGFDPCRWVEIQQYTNPLVNGLPRGVGYSGDISPQTAQNTAEGRGMRLKGYGNAIVPQLAAEFVAATMECL